MRNTVKNLLIKPLRRLHERAHATPYFDLPGYMLRNWIFGFRSPERNGDNPVWKAGFRPKSSALYRWLCRHIVVRAHTILRSDSDRHLHDHPSWSLSIVLEGGYWEVFEPTRLALDCPLTYRAALDTLTQNWIAPERAEEHAYLNALGIYWRGPGAIVFRRATCFHRLVLPRGVITKSIFAMGAKTNSWGFLTPSGKVGWRAYLGLDKEKV